MGAPTCKCGSDAACGATGAETTPVCDADAAMCAMCNVDGNTGDGMAQGTCQEGSNCHSDGSCSFCATNEGDGSMAMPHSGCGSVLNPMCSTDKSKCECAADLICNSATATVCDTGACKCGGAECADGTPICDQTDPDNPACAACSVEGSGSADGSEKGNCPGDTDKCHSTGACAVCIDSVGDGDGVGDPHSGCTTDLPKCNAGVCEAP